MGKNFSDDLYKINDPTGAFDFNDDGEYDAGERAAADGYYIHERERKEREEREWYERDLSDDEDDDDFDDEDDSDDIFDDEELYGRSGDFSGGGYVAPKSGKYSSDDEGDEDCDEDGGLYSSASENTATKRQGATRQLHISFTMGDPKRDEYIEQNVGGKAYRNEAVKARAKEAFGEIYDVANGDKADEYYERAVFIRDFSGTVAADYCDYIWSFKITDAIEEAYGLPKEYTDCYESEDNIYRLFSSLREFDSELCLNVFLWAWKEFSPYKKYDENSVEELLSAGLNYSLHEEGYGYNKKLYGVLSKDRNLAGELFLEADKALDGIENMIMLACGEGDEKAARMFTEILLDNKIKKVNTKAEILLTTSYFMQKNKTAYYTFLGGVLSIVRQRNNAFLNKKADEIEEKLKEKAWEYGIEEEEEELSEESTSESENTDDWKKHVYIPYGIALNPKDFETKDEFDIALKNAVEAAKAKKLEAESKELAEKLSDKTIYTLYGIYIGELKRTYMYKSETPLNIGDSVKVPFGRDNAEYSGFVAYKKETLNIGVPFPIKNIKSIICK